MKVLFIGGTGVISMDAVTLALEKGHEVTVLTRGNSRMLPEGAVHLRADIRDNDAARAALNGKYFDVVVECVTFEPEDMRYKLKLLKGHYRQLIYISSAAVYNVPFGRLPLREREAAVGNPRWNYGRGKAACEAELERDHLMGGCEYTVIRPSETYNDYRFPGVLVADPHRGGYTIIARMRAGKPVLVHDDGHALCPFLHSIDMARAIVGLFLNPKAFGKAIHITSDEAHSWREVTEMGAEAAGVRANIVYVPALELAKEIPSTPLGDTYGVLMGSKRYDGVYDNSLIRSVVPEFKNTISLREGLRRVTAFYDTHPELQIIDEKLDADIERVARKYAV